MRRYSRETVFKLLFEYSFYFEPNEGTLALMLSDADLDDQDKEYIKKTYRGVVENYDSLKQTVASQLKSFAIERLYRPDLIILMIGAYELEQKNDPERVIINEAVELAKKFGTERSGGFVNGVLGAILRKNQA